jgi:hypothetical protein
VAIDPVQIDPGTFTLPSPVSATDCKSLVVTISASAASTRNVLTLTKSENITVFRAPSVGKPEVAVASAVGGFTLALQSDVQENGGTVTVSIWVNDTPLINGLWNSDGWKVFENLNPKVEVQACAVVGDQQACSDKETVTKIINGSAVSFGPFRPDGITWVDGDEAELSGSTVTFTPEPAAQSLSFTLSYGSTSEDKSGAQLIWTFPSSVESIELCVTGTSHCWTYSKS